MTVTENSKTGQHAPNKKLIWRARLEIAGALLLAVGIVVFAWNARQPEDVSVGEAPAALPAPPYAAAVQGAPSQNIERRAKDRPRIVGRTEPPSETIEMEKENPREEIRKQELGNKEAAGIVEPSPPARVDVDAGRRQFLLTQARRELNQGDPVSAALLALEVLPDNAVDLPPDDWAMKPHLKSAYHLLYQAYFMRHELRVLEGHRAFVRAAAFSRDGKRIVTASSDQSARVWDAENGSLIANLKGHDREVWSAAFSPDGRRVMTVSFDNTARLWSVVTGDEIAVLRGHAGEVAAVAFNNAGTRVATASYDNTARVWDAENGDELAILAGHTARIRAVAFNPVNQDVLTASDDGTARIWDGQKGTLKATLKGHEGAIRRAFFSPDGRHAVTASADGTARIWAADTGRVTAVLRGHSSYVVVAEFSPDSRRVVTAAWGDKLARVWDTESGAEIAVLRGHFNWVNQAMFSPDGMHVLTASGDRTARLWDARTGALLRTFGGHANDVYTATFSPDGKTILTGSGDGTARLWRTFRNIHARAANDIGPVGARMGPFAVSVVDGHAVLHDERTNVKVTLPDQDVTAAGFHPTDGHLTVTGRLTNAYRLFASPSELVAHWKTASPRQLTRDQRISYFLLPSP